MLVVFEGVPVIVSHRVSDLITSTPARRKWVQSWARWERTVACGGV